MHFEPYEYYHLYNYGNNNQTIFFNQSNFSQFLKKVRSQWSAYCDFLAYCLLPNHFHFLLIPNFDACKNVFIKGKEMHMQQLSKAIGKTLSSYAQTINSVKNRRGSLFQKKTKARILTSDAAINPFSTSDLLINYMDYIHNIPVEAGFCKSPVEWEMSSARDYAGLRKGTFCNKELLTELTRNKDFGAENPVFSRELIKRIY